MAIPPNSTFVYRFVVQEREPIQAEPTTHAQNLSFDAAMEQMSWGGQGSGGSAWGGDKFEGLVGPKPEFVLQGGWLTLRPSDGWTRALDARSFADADKSSLEGLMAAYREDVSKAWRAWGDRQIDEGTRSRIVEKAAKQRGVKRDLKSYSVYVGQALGRVFQVGDELKFSRNGSADFGYRVRRNSEIVFSAGSADRIDQGGPFAVLEWRDHNPQPPSAPEARQVNSPTSVAEMMEEIRAVQKQLTTFRTRVRVRVKDQMFDLVEGNDLHCDPYYVFLTRTRNFYFKWRSVHAGSRLDLLGKAEIVDAAQQLAAPKVRIL